MEWRFANDLDLTRLDGAIHVWRGIMRQEEPWAALEGILRPDELARAGRFLVAAPRRQFVFARAGLRRVLARYLGCDPRSVPIRLSEQGKPELSGDKSSLRFNVSHAGSFALFAVARATEVGVDVERGREGLDCDGLGPSVCTPEELARWRELPGGARQAAFLSLWTRKEAVVKAAGVGLSVPPNRVHVSLPAPAHGVVSLSGVAAVGPFRVVELPIGEGYAGALAHTGGEARVTCYALVPFTG